MSNIPYIRLFIKPGGWAEWEGMYRKRFIGFFVSFYGDESTGVNHDGNVKEVD